MAKIVIDNLEALRGRVGQELATSDWLAVEQPRIDQFAQATGDHQWIHVDPARAAKESPFGGTVAHGFLTLSLLPKLMEDSIEVRGVRMGVNYGLNRVRFVSPVRSGRRVRATIALAAFEEIKGGAQLTWNVTVSLEGSDKPACVAELLARLYV